MDKVQMAKVVEVQGPVCYFCQHVVWEYEDMTVVRVDRSHKRRAGMRVVHSDCYKLYDSKLRGMDIGVGGIEVIRQAFDKMLKHVHMPPYYTRLEDAWLTDPRCVECGETVEVPPRPVLTRNGRLKHIGCSNLSIEAQENRLTDIAYINELKAQQFINKKEMRGVYYRGVRETRKSMWWKKI